jgi:hypothetical protein
MMEAHVMSLERHGRGQRMTVAEYAVVSRTVCGTFWAPKDASMHEHSAFS